MCSQSGLMLRVLKDKSGPVTTTAFEKVLARTTRRPMRIESDQGKEFYNS